MLNVLKVDQSCQLRSLGCFYFQLFKVNMFSFSTFFQFPASNYIFKVNNRNTRARCEIYSKLTIKTTGQRQ